jgi:hypothetical protein
VVLIISASVCDDDDEPVFTVELTSVGAVMAALRVNTVRTLLLALSH